MARASTSRAYRQGVLEAEDFPVAAVSEYLDQSDTIVWVDLCAPSQDQLHELADELGLHELAVEDALGPRQRPKLDHYATHLFLSCHAVRLNAEQGRLDVTEIDAFINARWLITVRKDEGFSMGLVVGRWDRSRAPAANGVSFLLYGLLDAVVDGYFGALQSFDAFYKDVSEGIFSKTPFDPVQQRQWFEMRRALGRFRRFVVATHEAVTGLTRRESSAVSDELCPYYQDVCDRILWISESTDALRDLAATIVETNLSLRDCRQAQAMKKVISWVAIIAVPTLIAGYYRMNVPYPGSGQTWGVVLFAVLVVVISGGLYALFRRREWL